MPSTPPYREACGPVKTFRGCCYQNSPAHVYVDKYTNTTTVTNDTGVGDPGTPVPPYERFTADFSGAGSCETHFCAGDAVPCSAWPEPVPTNVFTHIDGDLVDFAVGRKRGWKGVQAARSWHGAWPWTAPERGCPTNFCTGVANYQTYQATSSQAKYLSADYDVHMANHFDAGEDAGGYQHVDKTGGRAINPKSGEITSNLTTFQEDKANFGSGPVIIKHFDGGAGYTDVDGDGIHEADFLSGATTLLDSVDNDISCFPQVATSEGLTDFQGLIRSWNDGTFAGGLTASGLPALTDPNSYSGSDTGTTDGGITTWTADLEFSRSATVVSWDFTITQNNGTDEDNTWHYFGTITLSDANAGDDVLADIYDNLLATWHLNDDKEYPWRTDIKGSLAPYVTRKEVDNTNPLGFNPVKVNDLTSPISDVNGVAPFDSGWIPTYDLRDWFDDRIYQWQFDPGESATTAAATELLKVYDGRLLGAPWPAGYQNNFDFNFIDIRGCCQDPIPEEGGGSKNWDWYQVGWGMSIDAWNILSGTQIPRNATQVNNWLQGANKPAGAYVIYADGADYFPGDCISTTADAHAHAGDALKIVACKYAEILEQWPSQNFALPAGDMKFWYDETKVACATNVSGSGEGSTWTLIDPKTGIAPTFIDPDLIWGGPSVGGFYLLSAWDGTTATLGAKQFDVPSNWASKSNGDDATCFGALRWSDKPSLLGRAAITTTGPGTTFTFTSATPAFGMASSTHQEQVDLYDSTMTAVATNVTATRVDDTHFTIASGQPTAVFVQIHGAAKWYMNDAGFKGDLTVLQWWFDYRNLGEQGRLATITDCSSGAVSGPSTITYTNADCNSNDSTVAFPGNGFARFCQTPGCVPFVPCAPRVVCIAPESNAETFPNGIPVAMPTTLNWDEQYGTRYQAVVDSTMVDLFWQPPHYPCNIESCSVWIMDDGNCHDDSPLDCPDFCCPGDAEYDSAVSVAPKYYYGLAPLVEARLTVPNNYGAAQNESAPALPAGIQIGWLSPVSNTPGTGVALPPTAPGPLRDSGIPGNCNFTWALHDLLCTVAADGCRFNYNYHGC